MGKIMRFFIAGLVTVFLTLHVSAQQSPATQNDTLCISSAGSQNQVVINSKNATRLNDCTDTLAVKGQIVQRGQNNSVEINTKRETSNDKNQITNKSQNPKSKKQTEPVGAKRKSRHSLGETCNVLKRSENPDISSGQHVTISQSGKNNSIKINTR